MYTFDTSNIQTTTIMQLLLITFAAIDGNPVHTGTPIPVKFVSSDFESGTLKFTDYKNNTVELFMSQINSYEIRKCISFDNDIFITNETFNVCMKYFVERYRLDGSTFWNVIMRDYKKRQVLVERCFVNGNLEYSATFVI